MNKQKGNGEIGIIAALGAAVALAWKAGLALGLSAAVTGCGASSGWRVEFGVAPVTAINNNYSLGEGDQKDEKRP